MPFRFAGELLPPSLACLLHRHPGSFGCHRWVSQFALAAESPCATASAILMKPLAAALAIFASVVLTDAHWIVMQSISLVQMSWTASQTEGQTIGDVFSGKLVCDHCCAITEGRDTEGEIPCDLLTLGRILAPVAFDRVGIPERKWVTVKWMPGDCTLLSQHVPSVTVPPPWA